MRETEYRGDIDGLRAIAVVAVVLFHGFPELLPGGFVGVDIFFVISGYLISSQILAGQQRGSFSFAAFYARRARRLLPALFLVLAASAIAGWQLLTPTQLAALGRDILAGLAFVPNLAVWSDAGYFDAPSATKPLLHLWSLGIEEQFYLLWPIALAGAFRFRRVALLIGAIIAASFACNVLLVATGHQSAAFYLPFSRFWELLAGAAIVNARLRSGAFAAAGPALITLSIALTHETHFPGWKVLAPVVGTMLIVASDERTLVNRLLGNPALAALGLISYPLYLWHWPLLTFARIDAVVPLTETQTGRIVIASVVLAAATYFLVELPVRKWNPKQIIRIRLAAATGFALLCFGVATTALHGFPQRLPEALASVNTMSLDRAEWRNGACFLGVSGGDFAAECSDQEPANAPRVLLWGDSHAAALYPGFRLLKRRHGFRLDQFTSSSCPPLLGMEDPADVTNCKRDNDRIDAGIALNPPDVIVLAAYWSKYDLALLASTIETVRSKSRIVLIGPVPDWGGASIEARLLEAYKSEGTLLDRIRPETQESNLALDTRLRALAGQLGATYVSPLDFFCNTRGCMTRVGERFNDLISFDYGHLNPAAAQLFVANAVPQIFGSAAR
jgi:peptidoglycan/LPS O-acetylase OafA/YrhL